MVGDKELLKYICENIEMGESALVTLSKELESTDNKIKSNVHKSLEEYRKFSKRCKKCMKNVKVDIAKPSFLETMMTKMGSKMEFMRDNSDSKIAEMLIQGYNMGIMDITKKMNNYKGDVSKDVMRLAEDYKDMMQRGIDSIKGFL